MLITILAAGTRGDTQPYLALGLELKKAGYAVRIAAFENYADYIRGYGVEFYPIEGDVSEILSSVAAKDALNADNPVKFLSSLKKLKHFMYERQKDLFKACKGSDAVVYHPGVPIGYFIAQHYKIPSILATPFPMTPTREYPSLIFYNTRRLGRSYNYLTHKIFEKGFWLTSRSAVKDFWKKEFGRVPENFCCPYGQQNKSYLPTIVSCSQFVFSTPRDWPNHVYNTGYWFLDEEMDWKASRELIRFIEEGLPPVYVGFGSIGDKAHAKETTQLIIEALQYSGQRGILATGWGGLAAMNNVPEGIFMLDSAPHSWLFPLMNTVIHHGGAGTTAAGLRAGVPTIIIPFSNDQFAWGRRVYELGVGPKPIPRKQLTAKKLSDAINFALADQVKKAAYELGKNIQSETGTQTAVKVISKAFRKPPNMDGNVQKLRDGKDGYE